LTDTRSILRLGGQLSIAQSQQEAAHAEVGGKQGAVNEQRMREREQAEMVLRLLDQMDAAGFVGCYDERKKMRDTYTAIIEAEVGSEPISYQEWYKGLPVAPIAATPSPYEFGEIAWNAARAASQPAPTSGALADLQKLVERIQHRRKTELILDEKTDTYTGAKETDECVPSCYRCRLQPIVEALVEERRMMQQVCEEWETEKDSNSTDKSRWYEMALLRCARAVRKVYALERSVATPAQPEGQPRREMVVQAIWDWLHGQHEAKDENGDLLGYKTKNANLWGVIGKECVGIDDEINLYELADAVISVLSQPEGQS
jgi:hypothetical protein